MPLLEGVAPRRAALVEHGVALELREVLRQVRARVRILLIGLVAGCSTNQLLWGLGSGTCVSYCIQLLWGPGPQVVGDP